MSTENCNGSNQSYFLPRARCQQPQDVTVYTSVHNSSTGGGSPFPGLGDLAYINLPAIAQEWVLYDNGTWGPLPNGGGGGGGGGITSIYEASDVLYNPASISVGQVLSWNGSAFAATSIPVPDIPWDDIDDHINDKVDDAMDDIIDLINRGELDVNTLQSIIDGIIADHPRIMNMIDEYELPENLATAYVDAYTALMLFIQPYLDGTKKVVDDPALFEQMFQNYYDARAAIEMEVHYRVVLNQQQAQRTYDILSRVINYDQVQIFPEDGVIVAGTLAVGTPTYNNAGVTGVTDQGPLSVRFWAGSTYFDRYTTSKFRVNNQGDIWVGNATSGFDWNYTVPGTLTLRGPMIINPGGGSDYSPVAVNRGPYSPSNIYTLGNLVTYGGVVWEYMADLIGNGGVPDESNPNWQIYLAAGSGAFIQRVYKRSSTQPATPTGGTWSDPFPDDPTWTDGPGAGIDQLWQTSRIFTQDGGPPQQSAWREPYEASDSYDEDWEWCSLDTDDPDDVGTPLTMPHLWSNISTNAFWEARMKIINGAPTNIWKVYRVRGEKGEPGTPGGPGSPGAPGANAPFIEERYAKNGSPTSSPTPPSPGNRNPAGWSTVVPSVGVLEYLWVIRASIDPDTDEMVGIWSNPSRFTGVIGQPGADGAPGADGEDGISPPMVVYRDIYDATATYKGNSNEIHFVIYAVGSNPEQGYFSRTDAGTFSGIPPTNTAYWNVAGITVESVYTKALVAVTADINTLGVQKLSVKTGSNQVRTIVGGKADGDSSSSSVYSETGIRTYYASGHLASYQGVVSGATTTVNGELKTINGYALVCFVDGTNGSNIFWFIDSSTSGAGVQYSGNAVWYDMINNYKMVLASTVGATDAQLRNALFGTTDPLNITLGSPNWCSSYTTGDTSALLGMVMTTVPPSIFIRHETGQPNRYVTTLNGTTPVPNGWYYVEGLATASASFSGSDVTFELTVPLIHINNGYHTGDLDVRTIVVDARVTGSISSCAMGTPMIPVGGEA